MINRHPSSVLDAADVVRIDRSQRGLLRPTISHDVELLVTNFVAVSVSLHAIFETVLTISIIARTPRLYRFPTCMGDLAVLSHSLWRYRGGGSTTILASVL